MHICPQGHRLTCQGCLGSAPADVVCMQEAHIAKLKTSLDAEGDASLQNALTLCVDSLKSIPPYGHREVHLSLHTQL